MIQTIRRNIARNRLIDMGVKKPNRSMGQDAWRRVLFGELKSMADRAFDKASRQRAGCWKRWKAFWNA